MFRVNQEIVSKSISTEVWQSFVPLLADAVSSPTAKHPTTRVWKDTELINLVKGITRANRDVLKTTFPAGDMVLARLERMGWLRQLPLAEKLTERTLYLMDLQATQDATVDPLEALLAFLPPGVISYFGAISFHQLTSQIPAFFHIGRLIDGLPPESTGPAKANDRNPLGTALFHYDGVPCYETKRFRGLTPGVQMRVMGPRTSYRITTLEQTLLDAILQPQRCGGEAVAFEAWEQAAERADFDRMADYLQSIGRNSLLRRVGAMLEMIEGPKVGSEKLRQMLNAVKERIGTNDELIPLLPGLNYGQPAASWRVLIP